MPVLPVAPASRLPGKNPAEPEMTAALSLDRLIEQHSAALYRYAYRLTGSAADAEDLVQQAFMVALRKLDQVREPEHVSAWLYAVLRSCFLKSVRKVHPQAAGVLELNLDQVPDHATVPSEIDRDQLQLALDELPPEYKLVVVMFYFEHASYKEIADRLELPMGTVMSRLARSKQRLRVRLGGGEDSSVRLAERNEREIPTSPATLGRRTE